MGQETYLSAMMASLGLAIALFVLSIPVSDAARPDIELGFTKSLTHDGFSKVMDLTSHNFNDTVGRGRGAAVLFTVPWCDLCEQMDLTWQEVADSLTEEKVVVGRCD